MLAVHVYTEGGRLTESFYMCEEDSLYSFKRMFIRDRLEIYRLTTTDVDLSTAKRLGDARTDQTSSLIRVHASRIR
jgi:hypothetical protein